MPGHLKKVLPGFSTAQDSTSSLIAVGLFRSAAVSTRYFRLGCFKALMTAAYGHSPLLKIVLLLDDDARAENGILAVQAAEARVLHPPFGNFLLV